MDALSQVLFLHKHARSVDEQLPAAPLDMRLEKQRFYPQRLVRPGTYFVDVAQALTAQVGSV